MITSNKPVAEAMQKCRLAQTSLALDSKDTPRAWHSFGAVSSHRQTLGHTRNTSTHQHASATHSSVANQKKPPADMAVAKQDADNLQSELSKRKIRYCEVGYVKEGLRQSPTLKDAKVIERHRLCCCSHRDPLPLSVDQKNNFGLTFYRTLHDINPPPTITNNKDKTSLLLLLLLLLQPPHTSSNNQRKTTKHKQKQNKTKILITKVFPNHIGI